MPDIYVEVQDLWNVFQTNKEELRTILKPVAENMEYGIVVYLTEDNDYPMLVVYVDDSEVYREPCISEDDCIVTGRKIYERYVIDTNQILESVVGTYESEDDDQEEENDDDDDTADDAAIGSTDASDEEIDSDEYEQYQIETKIEDREKEIDDSFQDFMYTVLEFDLEKVLDNPEEIYEDCKEHFLEYIARKWGLAIRRPMILEDDNGDEFFEEYPYDCMEFDDEDNPIYK